MYGQCVTNNPQHLLSDPEAHPVLLLAQGGGMSSCPPADPAALHLLHCSPGGWLDPQSLWQEHGCLKPAQLSVLPETRSLLQQEGVHVL